ncbi:MAG: MATE family efflux transporter [Lachnospiraceae bacterium]|nr:MATE family efflux transporter [Lachnospiraceae bacterium]
MSIQLSEHFTYKKLFRFCLPTIAMMLCTSLYGIVDGYFVSNYVGKTAFASVNLVMPFLMILGCFGFMVGTGGSALVGKTLGEGKRETADQYFTMLVYLTVILGVVLSVIGVVFMRPIAYMLGADENMIEDCVIYGRIMNGWNTAFMLQYLFQSFFVTAEKPQLGFMATVAAGCTNIVLDALFIAVFQWGVAGAAWASVLGQCIGGILPLLYFLRPNSSLLRLRKTRVDKEVLLKSCLNGSSELMTNISTSLVGILYNFQLMKYAGENGVAAYGVVMYTQFVFAAVFLGYTIGTGPIVSFHYGAGHHDELKNMLKKSLLLMLGSGIIMLILALLLASPVSSIFVGYDAELLFITRHALSIYAFSFVVYGINVFASAFFTALSNGAVSAAIAFLRTLVFQTVAVLALPLLLGLDGIWWAVTVAEILALIVSSTFLITKRKQYRYL